MLELRTLDSAQPSSLRVAEGSIKPVLDLGLRRRDGPGKALPLYAAPLQQRFSCSTIYLYLFILFIGCTGWLTFNNCNLSCNGVVLVIFYNYIKSGRWSELRSKQYIYPIKTCVPKTLHCCGVISTPNIPPAQASCVDFHRCLVIKPSVTCLCCVYHLSHQ